MKKIFIFSLLLLILAIGTVSASSNATTDDINLAIEKDSTLNSDNIQEEPTQIDENDSPMKSPERINASYEIHVEDSYLEGSGFEGKFNIEMFEREFLNGNLEIYIDDYLKFKTKPEVEYDYEFDDSWESSDYPNSYSILDVYFLDRLDLTYGQHKAEFKYSGDSLFNGFDEIRYFNYTYLKFYLPEDENEYESTCVFCVESPDATGNLKIVLDNQTIHENEFSEYEYITIDFDNLTFGTHAYDIYYTGDDYYPSIQKHGIFKKSYKLEAYFSDFYEIAIDNNELEIYLPEDAKSNVTIVVNNKTYSTTPKNGKASVKITNLNMGENTLFTTYKDDKYPEKTISTKITVLPAMIFPYSESCEYEKDANATLVMSEDAKGTLKIKIDNEYYACELVNGTASIPLNMIGVGVHDFEITYNGDYEDYFENKTYENINISEATPYDKMDWDIEFSFYVENDENGCNLYVKLSRPDDLEGTQTYYIDGEKCGEYEFDGYYNPDSWTAISKTLGNKYLELSNGTHTLTVSHSGDESYIAKNKTATFTKPLNNKVLSGAIIEIITDIHKYLTIEVPEGENGTASITINNDTQTVTIENQTYISNPLDLIEDIWDIKVEYKGNTINKTKSFKLDTITQHFTLQCDDIYYKDSEKIAFLDYYEEDDIFLKHVSIFIDNKKYQGSLDYGEISFNKLSPGIHTILVNYKNDNNVIIQSENMTFSIVSYSYPKLVLKDINSQELNKQFKITDSHISLSNDTTLVMDMDLNYNVKGTVTAYKTILNYYGRYDALDDTIIGECGRFNLNKGKTQISIPTNVFNGTYSLKLVINLEDGNTINLSFKTVWCPKVEHPAKMTYADKKTLTVYVPGQNNRMIGMFGNFKPVYSQIVNGTAKFPLSSLPIGNGIRAVFIYSSDDSYEDYGYYTSILNSYDLKLNIQDSSNKITMFYNDGTTYSLKVSKIYGKSVGKGKTVTFKIGKNTFKVKTDKNGVAKLKIPDKIKPGTYTLTATYKYGKITKKLIVKQVLSVKTVNVKKSGRKLVLTATLKKGKTALKSKLVNFKFNGKTYKTKTNSKGIAKVTIKSSVLKKLKVGKKITYQATYLKDTVKKTAKVQK